MANNKRKQQQIERSRKTALRKDFIVNQRNKQSSPSRKQKKKRVGQQKEWGSMCKDPGIRKILTTELEARGEIEKSLGGYWWQSS